MNVIRILAYCKLNNHIFGKVFGARIPNILKGVFISMILLLNTKCLNSQNIWCNFYNHWNYVTNDSVIKEYLRLSNGMLLNRNSTYCDYLAINGKELVKLEMTNHICNPMSSGPTYLYLIFNQEHVENILYKCSALDTCANILRYCDSSFKYEEKEILGFLKNNRTFDFINLVTDYQMILYLYHIISYAEIENLNMDFTSLFREYAQPKMQLCYPITCENDLGRFSKIIKTKGFMGFYRKMMPIAQIIDRPLKNEIVKFSQLIKDTDFQYLYGKIDSLNMGFLQKYIPVMKEDLHDKKAIYLYSLPDLKLFRIRFEVADGKIRIFKKYINPQYIWDTPNSIRILDQKFFM